LLDLKRIIDYDNALLFLLIMARSKKSKIYNLCFIVIIALLIIPQTRMPIQVFVNKAMMLVIKPSEIESSERTQISNYNWKLKNRFGKELDFTTVRGKVVVVNFWATWCPPCVAEMPSLQNLYETFKDNDEVVFLYVSNEDIEVIDKFINKKGYTFEVYQSLTAYPKEFNVSSIPRTFVINKKGEIVIDKTGPANWSSDEVINTIDDLLKVF